MFWISCGNKEEIRSIILGQKEGHKSFECPEAKRSGGRDQSSKFLTDHRKSDNLLSDGGGGGCFNCGKDGHKSFDCPEPKKGRSSSGTGGVKRSFHENGHNGIENTSKKIRFNDDDD